MLVTFPAPSHSRVWQSPATCVAVAVPAARNVVPHLLAVQVGATHSLLVGQSAADVHEISPASAVLESTALESVAVASAPPASFAAESVAPESVAPESAE